MPPTTLPGYGLDAPTHDSIIAAFAKYVSPAEADTLWTTACARAGVRRHGPASPEDLRRACDEVVAQGGLLGICANSLKVRLISYAMLRSKTLQLAGAPAGR